MISNPDYRMLKKSRPNLLFKKLTISIFLILSFSMPPMASAYACQGSHLQKSIHIIEQAWIAGTELGAQIGWGQIDLFSAMQQMMQLIEHLNRQSASLPQSCQVLVSQWANAISQAMGGGGYGGGTQCIGGVCCDSGGCL